MLPLFNPFKVCGGPVERQSYFFLSLIFEKSKIIFYKRGRFGDRFLCASISNFYVMAFFNFFSELRNSYLVDLVCWDCSKRAGSLPFFGGVNVAYLFYSYCTSSLFLLTYLSGLPFSLSGVHSSSTWLEREAREFFSINFRNQLDSRNLILEYSFYRPVLKKKYKVGGAYNCLSLPGYKLGFNERLANQSHY